MDAAAPRTRRRWLQFSLRSLLVLTAVAAVLFAWLGQQFYYARQQRQAVDAILASGGEVYYDYQAERGKEPPGPKWLRGIVGDDFFARVHTVHFRGSDNDANLATLRHLPHLKEFWIHLSASRNIDPSPLADLHSLKRLSLSGEGCTDAHLSAIAGLKNLEGLYLHDTNITDGGLDHLQGLIQLRWMRIGAKNMTDAGVVKLKPLTNLTTLHCSRFRVMMVDGLPTNGDALDRQTICDFSEAPIPAVAYYFSEIHNIPILVDTADPNVVKLVDSVTVTSRQKDVALRDALEAILRPLGLGWTRSSSGLLITTREKAAESRRGLEELKRSLPNLTTVTSDW